jgi:hypothetical protein
MVGRMQMKQIRMIWYPELIGENNERKKHAEISHW